MSYPGPKAGILIALIFTHVVAWCTFFLGLLSLVMTPMLPTFWAIFALFNGLFLAWIHFFVNRNIQVRYELIDSRTLMFSMLYSAVSVLLIYLNLSILIAVVAFAIVCFGAYAAWHSAD